MNRMLGWILAVGMVGCVSPVDSSDEAVGEDEAVLVEADPVAPVEEHVTTPIAAQWNGGTANGPPPPTCAETGCDDGNDCTNDVCYDTGCQHHAFDHLHSCNGGAGFCDGNIQACCTELDVDCCKGCKLTVGGVTSCVAQCPGGMTCSPISVECAY